jgi:hypothetical protein
MSLVHNERTKLTATWISGLATVFIAAGLFAPVAAGLAYGITDRRIGWPYILVIVILCMVVGAFLHWTGRLVLGRLRE